MRKDNHPHDQKCYDDGYRQAVTDFIYFSIEGRTEPFEKIKQAAKVLLNGKKRSVGRRGSIEANFQLELADCRIVWLIDKVFRVKIVSSMQEAYEHANAELNLGMTLDGIRKKYKRGKKLLAHPDRRKKYVTEAYARFIVACDEIKDGLKANSR
jgi:hypothetical protein